MGELPEYIRIEAGKITEALSHQISNDNTYKFLDSGASGKVYLKNTGDSVIKLLFSNDFETPDEFTRKCLKEIELQTHAAQHKLAPMPYYQIYKPSSRFGFGSRMLCYVEMKFLKEHIFPQDYPKEICAYIHKLASIGLINKVDPLTHFYIDDGNIQMIDFGNVELINQDDINGDIKTMSDMCGIDCSISAFGKKRKHKKSKRKNKYKRPKSFKVKKSKHKYKKIKN